MPTKQHIIALSAEERATLEQVACSTRRSVLEKRRARILLESDTNVPRKEGGSQSDLSLAARHKVNPLTVSYVRRRAHERGALASVVRAEQQRRKERKLDGSQEAQLVAVTCSAPPDGCARWSLRLIRERLIELEVVEDIAMETIRQTLKKTPSSRG